MMGANYYPDKNAWSKSEFNIRNDLNAFDYLLDSNVEMHIMPASTAWKFKFDKKTTKAKLNSGSKLDILLSERWEHVNAGENWVMWDLALLIAYCHPAMATESVVNTPPENKQRNVYVYTDLDPVKMEEEFWKIYNR
jgi:inosine-uridine nucleoside N-ribohydrolase